MRDLKANLFLYLIVAVLVLAIFSTVGLAFFGIAILSAAIVGALIGIFIPAILVLAGFVIFYVYRSQPKIAIGALLLCLAAAWVMAMMPGGGL